MQTPHITLKIAIYNLKEFSDLLKFIRLTAKFNGLIGC